MSKEIDEKLQLVRDKIYENQKEIRSLTSEIIALQKEKVMKNKLFQIKVVQDLFSIFKIDPTKITNFYDDYIEFSIKEYKMKITIDPQGNKIVISYEPILNFDGGIDPEGEEEELQFFETTAEEVLMAMRIMLNDTNEELERRMINNSNLIRNLNNSIDNLQQKRGME